MILPGLSLGLLAALSALYAFARPAYMTVMTVMMHRPWVTPFFDLEYLLASATCWQQGIDVYAANPCDPLGRPMNYSPLLLRLRVLALDRAWALPLGLAVAVCYCLSLGFLVPTGRRRDWLIIGLAGTSSLAVLAVERGNIDVLIYLGSFVAGHALGGSAVGRLAGYAVLMTLGAVKFYPFAALVVILRERLALCIGLALAAAGLGAAFVLAFRDELLKVAANLPPVVLFEDMIGVRMLPAGLGLTLRPLFGITGLGASHAFSLVVGLLLLALVAGGVLALILNAPCRAALARLPPFERSALFIGAALLTGCFFAGTSVGYRAIHLLLVLPALLLLDQPAAAAPLKRLCRITCVAICFILVRRTVLCVFDGFGATAQNSALGAAAWIAYQLAWWWTITVLLGFLGCLMLDSRAVRDGTPRFIRRLAGRVALGPRPR